jgi:hypothetical protein
MPMINTSWSVGWLKDAPRLAGLLVFEILIFFWCIKLAYIVYGYLTKGTAGVREAILQHTLSPYIPGEWAQGQPRWDIVAVRYGLIAIMTILLGLANRRSLTRLWVDLWERPLRKPPSI